LTLKPLKEQRSETKIRSDLSSHKYADDGCGIRRAKPANQSFFPFFPQPKGIHQRGCGRRRCAAAATVIGAAEAQAQEFDVAAVTTGKSAQRALNIRIDAANTEQAVPIPSIRITATKLDIRAGSEATQKVSSTIQPQAK
jgi:hypothetical protein